MVIEFGKYKVEVKAEFPDNPEVSEATATESFMMWLSQQLGVASSSWSRSGLYWIQEETDSAIKSIEKAMKKSKKNKKH